MVYIKFIRKQAYTLLGDLYEKAYACFFIFLFLKSDIVT